MTKMIMQRRLEKNKKKGFTLIELIVVIVIIAIIAAIAVPALTRYIESANKRAAQATAHNIQVVLQAEVSDFYDTSPEQNIDDGTENLFVGPPPNGFPTGYSDVINDILEESGIWINPENLHTIVFDSKKLVSFFYVHNGDATLTIKYETGTFDFV